jgi:hypothetical protein
MDYSTIATAQRGFSLAGQRRALEAAFARLTPRGVAVTFA